jgi:hypothetical protein
MNLNENYRIIYDENNTILQYYQDRVRTLKDGSFQEYEYTESFYYPNLRTALVGFLDKCTWGVATAKEVLRKLNEVIKIIRDEHKS